MCSPQIKASADHDKVYSEEVKKMEFKRDKRALQQEYLAAAELEKDDAKGRQQFISAALHTTEVRYARSKVLSFVFIRTR